MNEQPVSVSKISWQDLCPWTNIFRSLTIAISPSVLVWAVLGVVLTPVGWLLSEFLFFDQSMKEDALLGLFADMNRSPYESVFREGGESESLSVLGTSLAGPLLVFNQLVHPFRALFTNQLSGWEFCYFAFGSLWTLFVWAFAGCAITRVALVRLTRNEIISIDDGFDFACQKYFDCLIAVAMPLLGVAAVTLPLGLVGLLMMFDFGAFLVSLLWLLVVAGAIVMVILLVGLLLGWPLIVASISAEGQNHFDATTRAFAYTLQKPLNYVFYALIAIVFGGFCWMVVMKSTNAVVDLGFWATSWGANAIEDERMMQIRGDEDAQGMLYASQKVIGFWNGMARTLAAGFLYGLFWCMASAVYLLLRYDVDETEMDELYLPNEQRSYELPPLKSDEFGIPQVQEPYPVAENSEERLGGSDDTGDSN